MKRTTDLITLNFRNSFHHEALDILASAYQNLDPDYANAIWNKLYEARERLRKEKRATDMHLAVMNTRYPA